MKKILLVLLALFVLTGCRPSDDNSGPTGPLKHIVTVSNMNKETVYEVEDGQNFKYSILESQTTNDYFDYWYYMDNNQEVKVTKDIKITGDIKIIAKYQDFYTVTVKYDKVEKQLFYKNNEVLKVSDLPTSSSSSFKYWYYVKDGQEVKVTSDITITSDLTIIAKYEGSTGTLPWV